MRQVVIIADSDPRKNVIGGVGIYARNLVKYLPYRIIFVGKKQEGKAIHKYSNLKFVEMNSKAGQSNFAFLRNLFIVARTLKIDKDAVIHSQRPDWLVPFAGFPNRKIVTLHGSHSKNVSLKKGFIAGIAYSFLERKGLEAADAIISVSSENADYYRKRYPKLAAKIKHIPLGIDVDMFKADRAASRKKYGYRKDDKVVVYVGRLEKEKNVEMLIHGCSKAGVKLLIAGDGKERKRLEAMAHGNARFLGSVPYEKTASVIACGDCLGLTSLYEGLPTVVIEAMACGVPVISTDVGDVRKLVVDGKTGYIVTKKNISDRIRKAMLLSDPALCRKTAQEYSFGKMVKKIEEVYG